jgi:uncharacterized protein YrzB (UPF0473 family)
MANRKEVVEFVKEWGCEQEFSVVEVINHLENVFLPTYKDEEGEVEFGICFLSPDAPGLEVESDRFELDVDSCNDFVLGNNDFYCLWNKETQAISYHSEVKVKSEDVTNSEVIIVWVC